MVQVKERFPRDFRGVSSCPKTSFGKPNRIIHNARDGTIPQIISSQDRMAIHSKRKTYRGIAQSKGVQDPSLSSTSTTRWHEKVDTDLSGDALRDQMH